MKIPCISIMQPFASLIAIGAKGIETRSKDFTGGFRGTLAIHASKRFPKEYEQLCYTELFYSALGINYGNYYPHQYLPLGCIVAVGDLVDVVKITDDVIWVYHQMGKHLFPAKTFAQWYWNDLQSFQQFSRELAFGDYTPGRFMLLLKNVVALEKPIPAKGRLGLWEFEMEDPRR
jgi:hypothetical protein